MILKQIGWQCKRCYKIFKDNASQCPNCGYTVYGPAFEEPPKETPNEN
jgi:rRNA maturation endonuclease Nob1